MNYQTSYRLENNIQMRIKHLLIIFLVLLSGVVNCIVIPEKPNPPRLVNDLAGMLSAGEISALETKLIEFGKQTTTQIAIVIVNTLNGEDKAMVATEIIHQWGIGQKDKDNGIVILVKVKTAESKGEVFIATGYGLEGVIPDATCKLIVENEIIPQFKQGKFYVGIDNAVNTIMKLSLKEFTAKEYQEQTAPKKAPFGLIFIIVVIVFFIINLFSGANNIRRRSIGKDIPLWMLISMMSSGSRRSGSFGNFSSGGGIFGGGGGFSGGGGFGGFGGGSSGGGGAGGSW